MKKLLSILGSLAITSVAATTVVSCSTPHTNINVSIVDTNGDITYKSDGTYDVKDPLTGNTENYSASELDAAMNGNFAILNQSLPVGMSFDELNMALLNVFSFNQSLVVKTQKHMQQLRDFRDTFLGRDQTKVNSTDGTDTPSVDGIKFDKIDNDNYYSAFKKTYINSLTGLYNLYQHKDDKDLGAALTEDTPEDKGPLTTAKELFSGSKTATNDPDAATSLVKQFSNSKLNPAFSKIEYQMPLSIYHSQSQIVQGFNTTASSNDGLTLGGKPMAYANNNPGAKNDGGKGNKLTDLTGTDPYGALVITPGATPSDAKKQVVINSDLNSITNQTDKHNSDQVLREYFEDGTTNNNVPVQYYVDGSANNYNLQQNIGEYLIKPVTQDVGVKYTYETDMEHNKNKAKGDSKQFTISFKLKNLAEIYSPLMTSVNGTTLSSVTKKDGNLVLKFSDSNVAKNIQNLNVNGKTVDASKISGSSVTLTPDQFGDLSDASKITFNYGDNSNTFTYQLNGFVAADGKTKAVNTLNFATTQLVWLFRGYKFMDPAKMNGDEFVSKFVNQQTGKKGKTTGAPDRDTDTELGSDIIHNLRDMKTEDWGITEVK